MSSPAARLLAFWLLPAALWASVSPARASAAPGLVFLFTGEDAGYLEPCG